MNRPEYKRDLYTNYMIFEENENAKDYCARMIINNPINGMLRVERRRIDEKDYYYYDITSRQAIKWLFERGQLNLEQTYRILSGVLTTLEQAQEYLLCEDDFVLDPEYIYLGISNFETRICYLPGYGQDMQKQLLQLTEYLMNKIDYKDEEAIILIYGVNKICSEGTCSFAQLRNHIEECHDGKRRKETASEEKTDAGEKDEDRNRKRRIDHQLKEDVAFEEKKEEAAVTPMKIVLMLLTMAAGVGVAYFVSRTGILFSNRGLYASLIRIFLLMVPLGAVELIAFRFILGLPTANEIVDESEEIPFVFTREEESDADISDGWREYLPVKEEERAIEREEKTGFGAVPAETAKDGGTDTVVLARAQEEGYYLEPSNQNYEKILLAEFPFFVGKLPSGVDGVIENCAVSRFHAKLEKIENEIYLVDLNSTNGTFVNGKRLKCNERIQLNLTDQIHFADVEYRLKYLQC
ncbi:MAG: FHA domain-containing protein [Lachnospiraceae bacterium]|nr:FHA domain-containing protein [Lachnospiraceae bacterium]